MEMYPAKINSPMTTIAVGIDQEVTTIELENAGVLPAPPNLATIGTGEDAETIKYEGVSTNTLTGVTRGFQGTAKSWEAEEVVYRGFTAYDHDTFKENLEEHLGLESPDQAPPHIYEDDSAHEDWAGVKYRLVVDEGMLYLEVVES